MSCGSPMPRGERIAKPTGRKYPLGRFFLCPPVPKAGALGLVGTVIDCSRLPLPLEGGVTLAQASAGSFHSCGFTSAGDGYRWGLNSNGQLGNGTTLYRPTPTAMAGGLSFSALTAFGRWHSCGLTTTGLAYCWGYGVWGQLGNGGMFDASVPVLVLGQSAAPGPAPLRASTGARRLARSARRPLSLRPPSP